MEQQNLKALKAEFQRLVKQAKQLKKDGKPTDVIEVKIAELKDKILDLGNKKGFRPGNDVSWWTKYESLLKDVLNILNTYVAGDEISPDIPVVYPGVMSIKFINTYGYTRNDSDAVNIWAKTLFLDMFNKYRTITNYGPGDLAILVMAEIEILCMICKLERIYGVAKRYAINNLNMPLAEAAALGLTPTQLAFVQGHLSDFRSDLNYLIEKAERLYIPKEMSVIANKLSLLGYEYMDHDNERAQIIIFDTSDAGVYRDTYLQTGGSIQYRPVVADGNNTADVSLIDTVTPGTNMFSGLEMMLDSVLNSAGCRAIIKDLLAWYGPQQRLQFVRLGEEYTVGPVYSEEILHKVHNIDPVQDATSYTLFSVVSGNLNSTDEAAVKSGGRMIYQDGENVVSGFSVQFGVNSPSWFSYTTGWQACGHVSSGDFQFFNSPSVIDSYHNELSPEIKVEGLLFKYYLHKYQSSATISAFVVEAVGFEFITGIEVYTMINGVPVAGNPIVTMNTSLAGMNSSAGRMSYFDWHPLSYQCDPSTGQIVNIAGEVDITVPVSNNIKVKAFRYILLSGLKTDLTANS